jgi:hypothetical protein
LRALLRTSAIAAVSPKWQSLAAAGKGLGSTVRERRRQFNDHFPPPSTKSGAGEKRLEAVERDMPVFGSEAVIETRSLTGQISDCPVDQLHLLFIHAPTVYSEFGESSFDVTEVFRRQFNVECSKVLVEVVNVARPWDWNNP